MAIPGKDAAADQGAFAPHILVVDDDPRLGRLLQRYLTEQGFRVTLAQDAGEARARLQGLVFDLLVVDVMMPGEDGLSLTAGIRRLSDVPILLLTARGEPADRIKGLEAGADDYLGKPFEPRELLLRIGTILRRYRPGRDGRTVMMGPYRFDPDRGELLLDGQPVRLTSAESMLLKIFAENPGVAISRADLIERTGASQDRSIDVSVTRLRKKIEPDPRQPRYLQTVRGTGYILLPD